MLKELQSWLGANKLKMNPDKTEFFIASSPSHLKRLQHLTFNTDNLVIRHSPSIRNLGVVFNSDMNMCDHVTHLCRFLISTGTSGTLVGSGDFLTSMRVTMQSVP